MGDEIIWLGLIGFFSFIFVALFANPVVGMSSTDALETSDKIKKKEILDEYPQIQKSTP